MQLTRAADYAVRVMIYLAQQPEGTVVSKANLAREAEAPESFLSKILQALARAGLIQARRGVVGGFSLLPRGAQASLLDVVESIDGPIALNVCVTSGVSCHRHAECGAHQVWLMAQSAMVSVLREARIADMTSGNGIHRTSDKGGSYFGGGAEKARQTGGCELPENATIKTISRTAPRRAVRPGNKNSNPKK